MNWKQIANDYLSFTRKERIGVFVILLIIALALLLPLFFSHNDLNVSIVTDSAWIAAAKKLEQKNLQPGETDHYERETNINSFQYDRRKGSYGLPAPKSSLFYFDPNILTPEGWEKLGVPAKTILTIQNYLSKGGSFRKPEDLSRIYGLRTELYTRLVPYVRIEQKKTGPEEIKPATTPNVYPAKSRSYQTVDINLADTSALIQLPGIGSKLASRIISFRDKLGGFYDVEQVRETFGLPDSTFQTIRQYLKLDNTVLKKIDINTASFDQLKSHPYIRYAIANAIISYRNEHGDFLANDDLKKIMIITDEVYRKIAAYLTTTN